LPSCACIAKGSVIKIAAKNVFFMFRWLFAYLLFFFLNA
jgi:hypothetical protein